jgi:acylphosphatase
MNSPMDKVIMPKRKCFQFIVKNKVQDVGLRLAIARLVPDELDVRADNLSDGSVRVVVRGQEDDVWKFWKNLQIEVLGKTDNPTFSQPTTMTTMSIDIHRFFHKLQCEQMEKFVDVGLEMRDSICSIGGKIDNMISRLDALPKNMALEIVKLKKKDIF